MPDADSRLATVEAMQSSRLPGSGAMPRVSVIIPTYNRARVVSKAIDSVLAQTYRDFEVIVVDDASTDDTAQVLARYGDRIRVIRRQTNGGPGAARNDGIKASEGEFIAFLDSDDLYLPCRLRISVEALDAAPDYGGAYANMLKVAPDGALLTSWLSEVAQEALNTNTATIRRHCFDEVGLFDESLHRFEDVHMWLRLTHRYPFLCIPETVAVWRTRQTTAESVAAAWEYPRRALAKILEDIPDLTDGERRLVRIHIIRHMAKHVGHLRDARLWSRARDVSLMMKQEMRELAPGDRLLVQMLMATSHPILGAPKSLTRWARGQYRDLRRAMCHARRF